MSNAHRDERILIVDDAPANIKILRQTLKDEVKISFATSGPEASKMALSELLPT